MPPTSLLIQFWDLLTFHSLVRLHNYVVQYVSSKITRYPPLPVGYFESRCMAPRLEPEFFLDHLSETA